MRSSTEIYIVAKYDQKQQTIGTENNPQILLKKSTPTLEIRPISSDEWHISDRERNKIIMNGSSAFGGIFFLSNELLSNFVPNAMFALVF